MKKACLIASIILLVVAISGCAKPSEKVLLIFSYHPDYVWVIEETRGAEGVLRDKGVQIEKFYLDTKRKTTPEWKKKVSEDAVRKIEQFKPDLVIVFDDNACELVAKKYIGKSLPFVFCGMNGEPQAYGFPAENIIGVIEREHLEQTISLLTQLVPDIRKAAIVTDDSPTSQGFLSRAKSATLPIEICEFYSTNDFDAWKAKVKELQLKVDAIGLFTYHTIREKDGEESLPPEDVLRWTLNNNRLPDFTFLDFTISGGVLCGVTVSGYEQGKAAADIAVRILNGEKPADIAVQCPKTGKTIINETRAKQLNITIPADVLKNAEVMP